MCLSSVTCSQRLRTQRVRMLRAELTPTVPSSAASSRRTGFGPGGRTPRSSRYAPLLHALCGVGQWVTGGLASPGGGLFGRILGHFHSGETEQEDLLQAQTLSWEVGQRFIRPTHPDRPSGQVISTLLLFSPPSVLHFSQINNYNSMQRNVLF